LNSCPSLSWIQLFPVRAVLEPASDNPEELDSRRTLRARNQLLTVSINTGLHGSLKWRIFDAAKPEVMEKTFRSSFSLQDDGGGGM
jgi:hypothetical protein